MQMGPQAHACGPHLSLRRKHYEAIRASEEQQPAQKADMRARKVREPFADIVLRIHAEHESEAEEPEARSPEENEHHEENKTSHGFSFPKGRYPFTYEKAKPPTEQRFFNVKASP